MAELDELIERYSSRADGSEPPSWAAMGYRRFPLGEPDHWVDESLPSTPLSAVADAYDVVILGAGAGGGMAASVIAASGASVLLVERGESIGQTTRDHVRNHRVSLRGHNTGPVDDERIIVLADGEHVVLPHHWGFNNNAMTVGGGTRVFGAQAWRFHPDDFRMATAYGVPAGSSLADWPITYDDLAPHYERVERDLGVGSFPPNREAEVLQSGADRLGWRTEPTPLLVNTSTCIRCGECIGFSCPVGAKTGAHNSTIPAALAHGATLVTGTRAEHVDANGDVRLGDGTTTRTVRGGHVVIAAGAIESARLLLLSGLGGDAVGRNLQGHPYTGAFGIFDEPVLDGLGPGPSIATRTLCHGNDGVIGGGIIGTEFLKLPIQQALWVRPPGTTWTDDDIAHHHRRVVHLMGPAQEVPSAEARVTLAGTRVRLSGGFHAATRPALELIAARAEAWLQASGARRTWQMPLPGGGLSAGQHQAGTCRMGEDPATSVVDRHGRVHGHDRLWVMDGSVHVTNGGVNPVLTILALAQRSAEALVQA